MPAYNAEKTLGSVIKSLPSKFEIKSLKLTVLVVVVEDGSTDRTYKTALKYNAVVIRHLLNSGAGAATRTGLRYAQSLGDKVKFAATIDSDGQHSSEDINKMLIKAIETKAQVIVGNRLHDGNKYKMPFHRTLGNKGLTLISRMLFGIKVEDTQSGLRLYDNKALPAVSNYKIDRYGFCTESLWHATRAKLKIVETPISVEYSEETLASGQSSWGVFELIKDLIWIRVAE